MAIDRRVDRFIAPRISLPEVRDEISAAPRRDAPASASFAGHRVGGRREPRSKWLGFSPPLARHDHIDLAPTTPRTNQPLALGLLGGIGLDPMTTLLAPHDQPHIGCGGPGWDFMCNPTRRHGLLARCLALAFAPSAGADYLCVRNCRLLENTSSNCGRIEMRRFIYSTILLLSLTPVWASAQSFRQVPGKLASISLGGTQTGAVAVWGINSAQNIFSFNGLSFDSIPGSLTQISVDGDTVVGINGNNDIFATLGLAGFTQISGKLTQISAHGLAVWGINANGDVFQFQFSGSGGAFQKVAGNLVQIAVDGTSVWGINANQNVFSYNSNSMQFVQIPGLLTQIAVGGLGAEVWGINASQQIFRFNSNSNAFVQIPGSLNMIAVGGPSGNVGVWGINAANNVFEFDGTRFVPVPGQLTQIAVFGASVWGINSNQDIFRLELP